MTVLSEGRLIRRYVRADRRKRARPGTIARRTIFLLLFFIAQMVFFSSDFFSIRTVVIEGTRRTAPETILKAAALPFKQNVLFVNLAPVAERIKKVLWVRKAKIKKILPGGISIQIEERQPVLRVQSLQDGRWVYVDSDGMVLDAPAEPPSDGLPRVVVLGVFEPGQKMEVSTVRKLCDFVQMIKEPIRSRIREFRIDKSGGISFLYPFRDGPVEILVGSVQDGEQKVRLLENLLPILERRKETPICIDVRFADPVVKLRENKNAQNRDESVP